MMPSRRASSFPCPVLLYMAASGVIRSSDIRALVERGAVTRECGTKAIRIIRQKVLLNGRKRR